jgi:hypothetical protein
LACKSKLYKKKTEIKPKGYETLFIKLKEINPVADREVIAKYAESLIENHFKQFKKC